MLQDNGDLIICRCEEVSKREIIEAIQEGCETIDEVKRMTRAGMGLCQGRTCEKLIRRIIAEETGICIDVIAPMNPRFPIKPIKVKAIANKQ